MSYGISEEASKTDTASLIFFFFCTGTSRNEFDVPATLMKFDSAWDTVSQFAQNGITGA